MSGGRSAGSQSEEEHDMAIKTRFAGAVDALTEYNRDLDHAASNVHTNCQCDDTYLCDACVDWQAARSDRDTYIKILSSAFSPEDVRAIQLRADAGPRY